MTNKARIYQPCKNAMQSGKVNRNKWVLEFCDTKRKTVDNVIGWVGTDNMYASELLLHFATKEQAENYAKKNNITYKVTESNQDHIIIKKYTDNF